MAQSQPHSESNGRLSLQRLLLLVIGIAIAWGTWSANTHRTPQLVRIAQDMLGESWLKIEFADQHIGYMHNHAFRDHLGQWQFHTTTHFLLQNDKPNTISKELVFAAQAPHQLNYARYSNRSQNNIATTEVRRNQHSSEPAYIAQLERENQINKVDLPWQFDLGQFLAFEQWLTEHQPTKGAQHSVADLDFERLQINQQSYRVVENNEQGYLIEINAPLAATQTQLNQEMQPIWLNMAGIFDVSHAAQAEAINVQTLPTQATYLFPVNQRLRDHKQIKSLNLTLSAPQRFNLPRSFTLQSNPITSQDDGSDDLGEALRYPISAPAIRQLVQTTLIESKQTDLVAALVGVVNDNLRYRDNKPSGNVLRALENGYGECTDFADLFTTLARAVGHPAKTVYGLAYADVDQPGFMFHAWNEIYISGRWYAADPTWGQTRVDATHIPLSGVEAATMMHANNASQVRFEVQSRDYF